MSAVGFLLLFMFPYLCISLLYRFGLLSFVQRRFMMRLPPALLIAGAIFANYPDTVLRMVASMQPLVASTLMLTLVLAAALILINLIRPNYGERVGNRVGVTEPFAGRMANLVSNPADPPRLKRDPSRPVGPPSVVTHNELYRDRKVVRLYDTITELSAREFSEACETIVHEDIDRVLVEINTQGGVVDFAWLIHERLRLLASAPGMDVCVLVMGPCNSAGIPVTLAVPVSQRFGSRHSSFMVHGCSGGNDQLRMENNERWVIGLITDQTAISRDSLRAVVDSGQDANFSATEALELGVIGGIV